MGLFRTATWYLFLHARAFNYDTRVGRLQLLTFWLLVLVGWSGGWVGGWAGLFVCCKTEVGHKLESFENGSGSFMVGARWALLVLNKGAKRAYNHHPHVHWAVMLKTYRARAVKLVRDVGGSQRGSKQSA